VLKLDFNGDSWVRRTASLGAVRHHYPPGSVAVQRCLRVRGSLERFIRTCSPFLG